MVFKKSLFILIVVALSTAFSTYLHSPDTPIIYNYGLKYSDILHGVFYRILRASTWFDFKLYVDFLYRDLVCPIPYVHYQFEYPPFIGLIWYISTCTGFHIATGTLATHGYHYLETAGKWHFYIQALIIAIFMVITVITMFELAKIYQARFNPVLFTILPSTIVYLVYNWDIIAVAFALLSIYMLEKKRPFLAGVLIGMAISTKILPIGIALWFFLEMLFLRRKILSLCKYIGGAVLTGVFPFIAIWLMAPHGFTYMIFHHAEWYCENCLYLPIIRDIYSSVHRVLYPVSIILFTTFITKVSTRGRYKEQRRPVYLFLFQTAFILFNYVFTPQMMLMISPLALIAIEKLALIFVYLITDFLNAVLIIVFFNELFSSGAPWFFGSLTQHVSTARNLLLLSIILNYLLEISGYSLSFKRLIQFAKKPLSSHPA
ncbi:MAG: glycosyltransferase 87 family protein [Desulfurococcaceae archaeon]